MSRVHREVEAFKKMLWRQQSYTKQRRGSTTRVDQQFLREHRNILCREKLKWVQPALSKHGIWPTRNILILEVFVGAIDGVLRLVKVAH